MSLEQALNENTAVMRELITALVGRVSNVGVVGKPQTAVEALAAGEVVLTTAAAAVKDDKSYFHDTKARAVYAFGPTDPLNGVQARCERIDAATYARLKTEYSKLTDEAIAATTSTSGGEAPAGGEVGNGGHSPAAASTPPTAAASDAPVAEPSTSATPETPKVDQVDWKATVLPAAMALAKKPGTGLRHLQALMVEFGLPGQTVPKLEALGKHAEVLQAINRRMASDEGL